MGYEKGRFKFILKKIRLNLNYIVGFCLVMCLLIGFSQSTLSADKISLREALKLGLENNSQLKQARYDTEKSDIDMKRAVRAIFPSVKLESTYTRMGEAPKQPSKYAFPKAGSTEIKLPGMDEKVPIDEYYMIPTEYEKMSKENYQTSITLNQPIYMGGKVRMGIKQARKGKKMTDIQVEQKRAEILNQIIQSYYNVLMARERVAIEKQALRLVREHKEMAKASFEAGTALKTDLLQAEIEETKAIHSLNQAQNQLKMARKNMINTLGIEPKSEKIKLDKPDLRPEIELESDQLFNTALKGRPEVRLTKLNREMTETSLDLEEKSNLPQVMLIGNYNWQGSEFSLENGSGNLMLSASMSLFDGGKSNMQEEKYKKELAKIDESRSSLKNMIRLEIEQQIMKIKEHKNNINLQKINLKKARESLEISKKRFEQGMGRSVEVLQAQTTLKQTRMSQMMAKYKHNMALFSLLKKTGQLVDYCKEVINSEK